MPKNATYLTIFESEGYEPKSSTMKVGVIKTEDMITNENPVDIHEAVMPTMKVLSYTYHGSAKMLSLQWKYLEEYKNNHELLQNIHIPTFELYLHTSLNDIEDENDHIFEICIPIT